MESKIKVIAKAQNQMALGIINAYLLLNPKSTLSQIRQKFSNDIAPDKGVKELFVTEEDALKINQNAKTTLYFTKPAQIMQLSDGEKITLSHIWTKDSLHNLLNHIMDKGIEVELIDSAVAKQKNIKEYKLEFINGFQPHIEKSKKGLLTSLIHFLKSLFTNN